MVKPRKTKTITGNCSNKNINNSADHNNKLRDNINKSENISMFSDE